MTNPGMILFEKLIKQIKTSCNLFQIVTSGVRKLRNWTRICNIKNNKTMF